jgi:hypothetical protein
MVHHYSLFCSVAMLLLAGCATGSTAPSMAPVGYQYYDVTHPSTVTAASPQAIYNATHGTWLWPPEIVAGPPGGT